jgi:hypothetical protein
MDKKNNKILCKPIVIIDWKFGIWNICWRCLWGIRPFGCNGHSAISDTSSPVTTPLNRGYTLLKFLSPLCATRPAYLISLRYITLIIFSKYFIWWSSSVCNFLLPPTTSLSLPSFCSFDTLRIFMNRETTDLVRINMRTILQLFKHRHWDS